MANPQLEILLFGPPEILLDGKPISIKRRINRALLFYIAAQLHPVTREALCSLFWPDETEDDARKKLREALSRLRTELQAADLIQTKGESIALNPRFVSVDYREMDALLSPLMNSSELNNGGTLPEWMLNQLKAGFNLGRTHHFLQGISLSGMAGFSNWMETENQRHRYRVERLIDSLVDHNISSGNLEEALIWLNRLLDMNPVDENANYLKLICLRDMEKPKEIIAYVNYLEGLFNENQFQIPQRFVELKNEALENNETRLKEHSHWPTHEAGDPYFIGREMELDALNRLLRKRGIVVLQGDEGIGKTRLLKQFYNTQLYEPRLLYCQPHPLAKEVPFFSLVQAIRTQMTKQDWQDLDAADKQLLIDFFDKVLQSPHGSGMYRSTAELFYLLNDVFSAAENLLRIASSHRPLLFIMEDVRWVDTASIAFIAYLVEQHFFEKYSMLVLVVSSETENQKLETLLQHIRRNANVESIELLPLDIQETAQFANRIFGFMPENKTIEEIQRLTGGNPFYLNEYLRAIKKPASGNKPGQAIETSPLPCAVFTLVQEKLNELDEISLKILKNAAILGRDFDIDLVEEMSAVSGDALVAGIEKLIREGFLMPKRDTGVSGSFTFKHDIEREAVIQKIGVAGRRHAHVRAAQAYLRRRKNRPEAAGELARHFQAAGDDLQAAQSWLDAGRFDLSQANRENSYTAYHNALELICEAPIIFDETLIYDVVNEWGNYAYDLNDWVMSEKIYQCCFEIGELKNNLLLTGAGLSGLGRVADAQRDYEKAEEYLQRAVFYLSDSEYYPELVKAYSRLGIMNFRKDDYIQAIALLEKAQQLDRGGKDQVSLDNRVNMLSYLCSLYIFTGNPLKAGAIAGELARLSILVNRKSAKVQAHTLLALTQYYNGQVLEALRTCNNIRDLAEMINVRYWLSLLEIIQSMVYFHIGEMDQSWQLADRVYRREEDYTEEKLFMHTIMIKGDILRSLGNLTKARGLYEEVLSFGISNYEASQCRVSLAMILVEEGRLEEAMAFHEIAINDARRKTLEGIALKSRMAQLMLAHATGFIGANNKEATAVMEEIVERGLLNHSFYKGMVEAISIESQGDLPAGLERYRDLQQVMERSSNVWGELQVLKRVISIYSNTPYSIEYEKKRVKEILDKMAEKTTLPAIKGAFQKFRNNWIRYVNVMSTRK